MTEEGDGGERWRERKDEIKENKETNQEKSCQMFFFFSPTFLKAPECNFRQVSEQLSTASPHNNKSDRNKGGHVAHCDGLPFTSKFQVYIGFDSVLK